MLTLKWAKAPDGEWFTLEGWNFADIKTVGVYHIWCVCMDRKFNVRSGQGIVGARLTAHKADQVIINHKRSGTLHVTWAEVPPAHLDGVERYLADRYRPVEGDRYPDAVPIQVNLPGQ